MLNKLIISLNFGLLLLGTFLVFVDNDTFDRLHKRLLSAADSTDYEMETLNQVDIDQLGRFKYVMIKVLDPATQQTRIIVRGFQWANYHADIVENFERVLNQLQMNHLAFSCLGGGRIYHNPDQSTIKIYGYSEAYGKADHELASTLIKAKYPNYTVTWSDEGY